MSKLAGTTSDPDSDQTRPPRQWPRRIRAAIPVVAILSLLGGCASHSPEIGLVEAESPTEPVRHPGPAAVPQPVPRIVQQTSPIPPVPDATPAAPAPDVWGRLRARFAFTAIEHPRVDKELRRLRRHPRSLEGMLRQARTYLPLITEHVEKRGLPGEIALLPAVESGFNPYAYSPNGAVGLWQFMPATANMLGLKRDRWYDGRRDLVPSTRAALQYLGRLRGRLDDNWLHALAAYNCGIGTVKRAVNKANRKGRSASYWDLDLPAETDAYIPRLIALAKVIDNPARYGIRLPDLDEKPAYRSVRVKGSLDLEVAARLAQVPLERLLVLNPAYLRGVTPPGRASRLLLPEDQSDAFATALAALPKDQWLRWTEHRIARGDTLGHIARRYKVSISAIREANGLRNNRIRAGRMLRIPLSGKASDARRNIATGPRRKVHYRVRKGDSLYTIARRFSVSIKALRRWNRVGRYIRPGQKLTVYLNAAG